MHEPQPPASDWESLGVTGALLSRYQQDHQALLEQLAIFLKSMLPGQTTVRRTLGVFGKRRATGMTVELGGIRYGLEHGKRSGLDASRTRVVRGVAVRTEQLSVEDWLAELTAALTAELARTTDGRAALTRLLQS